MNLDEIYEVVSTTLPSLANIGLGHPLLGSTSFFEEELILVGGDS